MTLLRHDLFLLCVLATKIGRLVQNLYCAVKLSMSVYGVQIWEFIKKKQENTLATKKAITKKRKKTRFRPRKKVRVKEEERKHDFDQEKKKETSISRKKARFKISSFFFYKFPSLAAAVFIFFQSNIYIQGRTEKLKRVGARLRGMRRKLLKMKSF